MNVALIFNVKPESETFHEGNNSRIESVPLNHTSTLESSQKQIDMYAEWDTWDTIIALKDALSIHHNVNLIEANENAFTFLQNNRPDIVFNVSEGFYGTSREAQIPSILDMLNIPYTGSDPLTLTTCLDKARTKEILSYYKIPNAKFFIAWDKNDIENHSLEFPLIVKPICEGSSKGIFSSSFVNDNNSLLKEVERIFIEYNQAALVEEFLPGREFTVALLGNGNETEVLPIIEINYNQFPDDFIPIYSYEAKWILDTKESPLDVFSCPARINKELEEEIKKVALNTYKILRCRDWSRIDIRLDKNNVPNVIEINPLPGILPDPKDNSCFPKAARTAGYDYNGMINKVLQVAAKRYNLL